MLGKNQNNFKRINNLKTFFEFQKHANAGLIPDGSNDICPYATSNNHFHLHQPNNHGKLLQNGFNSKEI